MNAVQGQRGGANNSGNGADPRLHYNKTPMIPTDAAAFFLCIPMHRIHMLINQGKVYGNVKKRLVSRSSLEAHIETRKR